MNDHIRRAVLLLLAAWAPASASAAIVDESDVDLTAFASYSAQASPTRSDFAAQSAPFDGSDLIEVEVLVHGDGIPFPNLPTTQTQAFASSAGDNFGAFGVGVNGFFFPNSLPPNDLVASGTFRETITNNSTGTVPVTVDFFVPASTIRFFGVGNSFPSGADPARDATASLEVKMLTKLTHPDGSIVEDVALDYGMSVLREPVSGVLFAFPLSDVGGSLSRFDEPDGSFGFQLSSLLLNDSPLVRVGPGDVFELKYEYSAKASTGFGETGVFAAIGDPFDLTVGGGHLALQVGEPVPEPSLALVLASGALAAWALRRRY
jgi:hypothetical protein